MIGWISKKKNQKAFTLIELVVVIAILGILAAIAIPRFAGVKESANVKVVLTNLKVLESAAGIYAAQENIPMTSVNSPTEDVKDEITTLVGTWPDGKPKGVVYTIINGLAYAKVDDTKIAWTLVGPKDTTYGYKISELQ